MCLGVSIKTGAAGSWTGTVIAAVAVAAASGRRVLVRVAVLVVVVRVARFAGFGLAGLGLLVARLAMSLFPRC